jgi:transposase
MQARGLLEQWHLDLQQVRERMYGAERPRERERWHALWLDAGPRRGRPGARCPHDWRLGGSLSATWAGRAAVRWQRRLPPVLGTAEQASLKTAVQQPPAAVALDAATWSGKAVRQCIADRFGRRLSPRSCLRYLHHLGFVCKRPKRRLLKADAASRAVFIEQYRTTLAEAAARGARLFFVDEAHFRADGDLRRLWTLKGQPALVDSTSPKYGEKASFYSAVCLETGEVFASELSGNSCAATSAQFLTDLRQRYPGAARGHLGQQQRAFGRGYPDLSQDAQPGSAAGAPAGLQPRFQCGRGDLEVGTGGGDGQHLLWHGGQGQRRGASILRWARHTDGGGPATLSDKPADPDSPTDRHCFAYPTTRLPSYVDLMWRSL